MKRLRIFLTDDHSLLLEALCNLLEPRYEVVGTASDGREMLTKVTKLNPDVVVLDISMPNLNGFAAAGKLKKTFPDIKFVFLTMNEEPDMVTEAFRIGASGYLLKNSSLSELFQAIDMVAGGGSYISPQITHGMINSFMKNPSGEKAHGSLTLRQREILQLLAEGKTMKGAADVLCITPKTVAYHKYRIMEDLGVRSNSELIQYAFRHGLAC